MSQFGDLFIRLIELHGRYLIKNVFNYIGDCKNNLPLFISVCIMHVLQTLSFGQHFNEDQVLCLQYKQKTIKVHMTRNFIF